MSTDRANSFRPAFGEIPAASRVLAQAFGSDPVIDYLLPDAARRERFAARCFACVVRYGLLYGEVHATSPNLEGMAVWLPPEEGHGSVLKMARVGVYFLPFTIGPKFFLRFCNYWQHIGRLRHEHTPFPHWFLQLLGVDPARQKQGHATRLLRPMLDRFDREQMACCLDTMNPNNVRFYERFGFQVVAKSALPGANADCWLMARQAQPLGATESDV